MRIESNSNKVEVNESRPDDERIAKIKLASVYPHYVAKVDGKDSAVKVMHHALSRSALPPENAKSRPTAKRASEMPTHSHCDKVAVNPCQDMA